MLKIAILYAGEEYSKYVNLIKFEESKGNLEVIGVGVANVYASRLDGYKLENLEKLLTAPWNYLVISSSGENFLSMKQMLVRLGINKERILPIAIFAIPGFDFIEYIKLYESKVSIIANNCWGGFTYHALGMEFLSPTINMFFEEGYYIRMLENLEYYFAQKVEFCREEYEQNLKRNYPVGRIADVEVHFNHYASMDEAIDKWEKRRKKINWDNLFVEMATSDRETAERFERLPYDKKIIFVPFDSELKSAVNIRTLIEQVNGIQTYQMYEVVNRMGRNWLSVYNPIRLLSGRRDFLRTEKRIELV